MSRLFWVSVGAVGGYYAARRGERLVADARERGVVGNITLAATTAAKVTTTATRTAVSLGEAVRSRIAESPVAESPVAPPAPTDRPREARP
jgi:hypothetical protein